LDCYKVTKSHQIKTMDKKIFLVCSFIVLGSLSSGSAETVGIPGKCPDVKAVEGFDPTKVSRHQSFYKISELKLFK